MRTRNKIHSIFLSTLFGASAVFSTVTPVRDGNRTPYLITVDKKCSGVLLSESIALTAAHCLYDKNLKRLTTKEVCIVKNPSSLLAEHRRDPNRSPRPRMPGSRPRTSAPNTNGPRTKGDPRNTSSDYRNGSYNRRGPSSRGYSDRDENRKCTAKGRLIAHKLRTTGFRIGRVSKYVDEDWAILRLDREVRLQVFPEYVSHRKLHSYKSFPIESYGYPVRTQNQRSMLNDIQIKSVFKGHFRVNTNTNKFKGFSGGPAIVRDHLGNPLVLGVNSSIGGNERRYRISNSDILAKALDQVL